MTKLFKTGPLVAAAALAFLALPIADAAAFGFGKRSNGMMRLGGPNNGNGSRNGVFDKGPTANYPNGLKSTRQQNAFRTLNEFRMH